MPVKYLIYFKIMLIYYIYFILGYLNLAIFDGFFFRHNITFDKFPINDNMSKDIGFCATSSHFELTVDFNYKNQAKLLTQIYCTICGYIQLNDEKAASFDGNFTFVRGLNVWNFIDRNFSGFVSRLRVGDSFPLKNPAESRLKQVFSYIRYYISALLI